ncbi:MAG: hypothetical protein AABX38_05440 [Candidatus Micrarchaeota archaeon]
METIMETKKIKYALGMQALKLKKPASESLIYNYFGDETHKTVAISMTIISHGFFEIC